MKIGQQTIKVLFAMIVTSSLVTASGTDLLLGGVIGALIGSNSNSNKTTTHRTYKKKKSSIPRECSRDKWSSQVIGSQPIASNFQGIMVTLDNQNQLIIKIDAKNQLPSVFSAGDNVQLNFKFSRGSRTVNSKLESTRQSLIVSGVDAVYILDKLKSSSYVKVDFVNNKFCTRLRGSSNAIRTVESTMRYSTNNYVASQAQSPQRTATQGNNVQARGVIAPTLAKDSINNARITRAMGEHMNHAQRTASNQKEFAQKLTGIRPMSDLDAKDGNIYDIKIQYYRPGSEEIGEMWVDWFIDDDKGPMMRLHFMDPTHKYKTESYTMDISLQPIEKKCNTNIDAKKDADTSPSCAIVKDLLVADKWAKIAKKQELKRRYRKRVSYIYGDEKSKKSLSVNFQTYENGAMTAQLEEMKHGFPNRFNFTFKQALELARYIENTREKAHKKWMNKTRTKEDLDALFN